MYICIYTHNSHCDTNNNSNSNNDSDNDSNSNAKPNQRQQHETTNILTLGSAARINLKSHRAPGTYITTWGHVGGVR